VTEAPPPAIPAEGVWSGDPADLPNWDAMPRRNRRRKRRSHYPIWLKYVGWVVGLALLVSAAQIGFHALRSDSRDATEYAVRQLRLSVLRPNERVRSMANVWQRPVIDYFRATRGVLVLTDAPGDSAKPIGGRLLYLGLQPRDPLSPPDAPPTFDQREWPVDTLVDVLPTRTLLHVFPALRITAPGESRVTLGIPSSAAGEVAELRRQLDAKYRTLRTVGYQRREARRARARDSVATRGLGMREWFHTVRRGEALASIAKMFGTTPEQVRALNGITGDRIRIGDKLKVKGWTKQPVRFPAGVTPEF
jgi:hypothetical protein